MDWAIRFVGTFLAALPVALSQISTPAVFRPNIPKTWDEAALATVEVPLAYPRGSPKHISADYYYRIPVRPIYRSYPIYAPGYGPAGYVDWLKSREPEIVWDEGAHRPPLRTEADWVKAGELVFDAPEFYEQLVSVDEAQNPEWYKLIRPPLTREGVMVSAAYVVRKRGQVEVGAFGCWTCHTRVMADGSVVRGAQGNFVVEQTEAYRFRHRLPLGALHLLMRGLFAAPWLEWDPHSRLGQMSAEEIAALYDRIPLGVVARGRTSLFSPVQVPDLFGVKERRYLDHTGLQLNRGVADIMRYAALNQGMDDLASFDGFIPRGDPVTGRLPEQSPFLRYSEEQLYALALYLYSLKPPPNPNPFDDLAARGKKVFEREGCPVCHTPPLYSNNKLTPVDGFTPSPAARKQYDILPLSVGTDPDLALNTRRGTGYYKVPSLKGVWNRNMFGHGGWCASLEDWFDPARLNDGYVPTGFDGVTGKGGPVRGHPNGLKLRPDDKLALMRFLRTL